MAVAPRKKADEHSNRGTSCVTRTVTLRTPLFLPPSCVVGLRFCFDSHPSDSPRPHAPQKDAILGLSTLPPRPHSYLRRYSRFPFPAFLFSPPHHYYTDKRKAKTALDSSYSFFNCRSILYALSPSHTHSHHASPTTQVGRQPPSCRCLGPQVVSHVDASPLHACLFNFFVITKAQQDVLVTTILRL